MQTREAVSVAALPQPRRARKTAVKVLSALGKFALHTENTVFRPDERRTERGSRRENGEYVPVGELRSQSQAGDVDAKETIAGY